MAHGCCTNSLCADRETQLRLARLREELLTNFNSLLIDRIRFLEQTIQQWAPSTAGPAVLSSTSPYTGSLDPSAQPPPPPTPSAPDRLSAPSLSSSLRRSSSTTAYFLQSPSHQQATANGAGARSCPSSVDLSSNDDGRARFFPSKKSSRTQNRTYSDSHSNHLPLPMDANWSTLTNDLLAHGHGSHERGRLESRRFACDVDDNEVRALKAMIYMEQARKQNARPLTRLRQVLGISHSPPTPGSYTAHQAKKHSHS